MPFGGMEMVIVLLIALVLFGPSQLPKLGKMVGQTMRSVREGMDSIDPDKPLPETTKAKAKAVGASEDDESEE